MILLQKYWLCFYFGEIFKIQEIVVKLKSILNILNDLTIFSLSLKMNILLSSLKNPPQNPKKLDNMKLGDLVRVMELTKW